MAQQYVTIAELSRLGIPGDAYSGFTDDILNGALLAASGDADKYLRKRYGLPLVSWNDDLRLLVAKIASANLMRTRGVRVGGLDQAALDMEQAAKDELIQIARGLLEIDCVDTTPDTDEMGAQVRSDKPLNWRFTTGRGDDQ